MDKRIYFTSLFFLIILVSGCIGSQNTKENAEAVAQQFAINLQASNYEELYILFTPEQKLKRSKDDFIRYAPKGMSNLESGFLIFDKVIMQGKEEAYAYYTLSVGVSQTKMNPMHLVFTSEGWRVDAFDSLFTEGCLKNSDCGLDKPSCNNNLECVECVSDSDCKYSEEPYCSSSSYTCKECLEDYHCSGEKSVCYVNECEECKINSDCPSEKPFCNYDSKQGSFVCNIEKYGTNCITDSDCSSGKKCSDDNKFSINLCSYAGVIDGMEIECLEDSHCYYTTRYCNGDNKYFEFIDEYTCLKCRNDNDCGLNEKCLSGRMCY